MTFNVPSDKFYQVFLPSIDLYCVITVQINSNGNSGGVRG